MQPDEAQIVVAVDRGAPSLRGWIRVAGQADRPFAGWLGLLGELQRTDALGGLPAEPGAPAGGDVSAGPSSPTTDPETP